MENMVEPDYLICDQMRHNTITGLLLFFFFSVNHHTEQIKHNFVWIKEGHLGLVYFLSYKYENICGIYENWSLQLST